MLRVIQQVQFGDHGLSVSLMLLHSLTVQRPVLVDYFLHVKVKCVVLINLIGSTDQRILHATHNFCVRILE